MERIPSGIYGLDELIGNGFIKNSNILVTGVAGSGKTTFALQCLYNNAVAGKKGMFICTDNKAKLLIKNFLSRFPKLGEVMKSKKIIFAEIAPSTPTEFIADVKYAVSSYDPELVAIDSISNLKAGPETMRFVLGRLKQMLKNCTFILTSEASPAKLSTHGVEEFIFDNVIFLEIKKTGDMLLKQMHIRKMRGSRHSEKVHLYEILDSGIRVYE